MRSLLRNRWIVSFFAGVLMAGIIGVYSSFPRATITLEPGPATDLMFRTDERDIIFLPDSRRLITKDWVMPVEPDFDIKQFRLRLWDAQTGRFIASLLEGPECTLLVHSHDGQRIGGATSEGKVSLWETESGKELWTGNSPETLFFVERELCCVSSDLPVSYELKSGRLVHEWNHDIWEAALHDVRGTTPTGFRLVRKPYRVVNLAEGRFAFASNPELHQGVRAWRLSADGRFVRFGVWDQTDWTVPLKIWDLKSGTKQETTLTHLLARESFMPSGDAVATFCSIDSRTPLQAWLINHHFPIRNSDWWVKVYDLPSGRERYSRHGAILGVFSPDGQTLAVMREDYVVELWDWPMPRVWLRMLVAALITWILVLAIVPNIWKRKPNNLSSGSPNP